MNAGAASPTAAVLPEGRLARVALTLSRDKSDTLLLLGATLLVLIPHFMHLPLWVSSLCAITLAWRALITFRGTRMPPTLMLVPIAVSAMAGIFITYKTLLGREAGVAMAVMLVTFKLLEMHARRDLFVVIYLCFFLLLTSFFYSQSIGMGAMMALAIVALLTAQLSFQFTGAVPPLLRRVGMGVKVLAFAAPLALALFVLFPRIQGPLWGMPGDASAGRTGLSNSMAPGNIASLAQSSEIAFRAKFEGPVPLQAQRYWRGVVLPEFDGRTWSQSRRRDWRDASLVRLDYRGQPVNYQVTLEPHNDHWLFALDMPGAVPQLRNMGAFGTSAVELRAGIRIEQRMRYDARSYLAYTLDGGAELRQRERYLELPPGFNPMAVEAGRKLQDEADPRRRVDIVLSRFRTEPYSYTLQPPLLGKDSVDEFLYRTRAGFCEHYASAFVVLMRAAAVPARVVTGYQGGELNPVDGFMTVRQSDAHAWAEVWLGERGWVRVDPTAAVSPDRIERNLAGALAPGEQFDLQDIGSLINMELHQNSWIAKLRFQIGAINNGWDHWVLSYDPQRRRDLLGELADAFTRGPFLAALMALACLLVAARALRQRGQQDPVDALYSALSQQLGRVGLARGKAEGPHGWSARIAASELPPARKDAVLRFLQQYSAYKYGPPSSGQAIVSTLKKLLNSSR